MRAVDNLHASSYESVDLPGGSDKRSHGAGTKVETWTLDRGTTAPVEPVLSGQFGY